MKYCLITFVFLLAVSPIVMASDIAEEVKENCSSCHALSKVCAKLGQRDDVAWKLNIRKMNRYGADFPVERIEEASAYLAGLQPGDALICE